MSLRQLPANPNLEHLKSQARVLLRERLAGDALASQRFAACDVTTAPKLADALHVLAREYGFATWPALKLQVVLHVADPIEALLAAIKSNDAEAVRQVLQRSPSLKTQIDEPLPHHGFDAPPLLAAVDHQNRQMVDALLDFGANINERSRWWAGSYGVLDVAEPALAAYLIERGATVDIHAAARLGNLERVRTLLEANPELVEARGGDGQLPLHFAATVAIASLLLEYGAPVDARDIDHESTAAQYMVCLRPYRHEVAKLLIARGAETDILMAAALGDLGLVESILNDDPETIRITVNDRYFPRKDPRSGGTIYIFGFGFTRSPHMVARQFGHQQVYDLLMQRSPGWLRLIEVAELGDEALFREVLGKNPKVFERLTAKAARKLIGSAIRNNHRAVELLTDAGWPANPVMDNNQSALHYAAFHGNIAMVRALLAHHAPVDVVETEHGGNPLAWALYGSLHGWHRDTGDYPAVAQALLDAGSTLPQTDKPLEATEDVLEVIRQHTS